MIISRWKEHKDSTHTQGKKLAASSFIAVGFSLVHYLAIAWHFQPLYKHHSAFKDDTQPFIYISISSKACKEGGVLGGVLAIPLELLEHSSLVITFAFSEIRK
ncbi:unnamed protein product [Malus baccata var. baccata]